MIKKLKIENIYVMELMDCASYEKLNKVKDKIFEITSWEEVEEILSK